MAKIILVTGGARSGKSNFAQELLLDQATVCYIATNSQTFNDSEMQHRVALHKASRPQNWTTEERFLELPTFLQHAPETCGYLLDCATLLTTNYFYWLMAQRFGDDYAEIDRQIAAFSPADKEALESQILEEWGRIVATVKGLETNFVMVTNEVGLGIVPENAFTRWFRDVLGRVNQFLGKAADEAYLVVASIPVKLK